jgi:hypothetical protein
MKSTLSCLSLCILLCGLVTIASAKTKERPDSDYQDGVLVSFRTTTSGSSCSSSGTVKGEVSDSGDVDGTTDTSGACHDISIRLYTIKVGDNTFVVKHAPEIWNRKSVLVQQLPGFRFKVRTQKDKLFIKAGDRESAFFLIGAQ